jgi:hypothetical protein
MARLYLKELGLTMNESYLNGLLYSVAVSYMFVACSNALKCSFNTQRWFCVQESYLTTVQVTKLLL